MTDRAETKEPTSAAPSGTKATDRLGRDHRRGARGRFVKQEGDASPAAARLAADKALLPGLDGRRFGRFHEIVSEHISDMGGADNTSAAERSIIRRIGALTVQLEALESKFDAPGASDKGDVDLYIRGAGGLRRLLQTLHARLERQSKDVTPGQAFGKLLHDDAMRQQREDAVKNAAKREAFEQRQREQAREH
jgi:hypothetical protein